MPAEMRSPIGSVPVPDPTVLTTQALQREIDSLRERTTHDNQLLRELIEARLDGNDAAVALLHTATDKIPAAIASSISNLRELHEEKFASIAIQFKERDVRADQTSRDSKVAVDAALKAQQEAFAEQNKSSALAISKSEGATLKQIDLISSSITNLAKSFDDKVSDIKDRLTTIESRSQGRNDIWGFVVGAVGVTVGIATVATLLLRHGP